ncbi:MAG: hypothetical protein ACRDPK_14315 [Carbonactinosporaceae bacterium]
MHPLARKGTWVVAAGLAFGLFGTGVLGTGSGIGSGTWQQAGGSEAGGRAARHLPQTRTVLFDASHGEPGSISSMQPNPLVEDLNPADEDDWTGTLSAWGVGLQRTGRYVIRTLPSSGRITYGDPAHALDLERFDTLILPAPAQPLTEAERAAVLRWLRDGGGLFLIAGGAASRDALGDLVAREPFGFSFERAGPAQGPAMTALRAGGPILAGPFGQVAGSTVTGDTALRLDSGGNPTVRGWIWRAGEDRRSGRGLVFATAALGRGHVAAWSGGAAVDDGTPTRRPTGQARRAGGQADNHGWAHPPTTDGRLALNATAWLASG